MQRRTVFTRCVVVALICASAVDALVTVPMAAGSRILRAASQPLVLVIRHGGLCATGAECRSTFRITDTTISGDGFEARRLRAGERAAILRAIKALNSVDLRANPFKGTCPTAYDGQESIYRFRHFARPLASCHYDLRGVVAVRLTERLLATLRAR